MDMKKYLFVLLFIALNAIPIYSQNTFADGLKSIWKKVTAFFEPPHYDYEIIELSSKDGIKINGQTIRAKDVTKIQRPRIKDTDNIEFDSGESMKIKRTNTDNPFTVSVGYDSFHPNSERTIKTVYEFLNNGGSRIVSRAGRSTIDDLRLDSPVLDTTVVNSFKGKRIALLIGNENYHDADKNMKNVRNAINDVYVVAEKLRSLGFHTYIKTDANIDTIMNCLFAFRNTIYSDSCAVALFYYAGHGQEDGNKQDYLIPVNSPKDDVNSCIRIDSIQHYLNINNSKDNTKRWIFIDACRTENSKLEHRNGVGHIDNTIIMYSTGQSIKANSYSKPDANNSPFANAFISEIDKPNRTMSEIMKAINQKVSSDVKNGEPEVTKEQIPQIVVGENCDYILNPQIVIPSCWYLGLEASFSSPLKSTWGGGLHGGVYLWKGLFAEIGTTINYLNPDKLYLYNSFSALTPSDSYNYHFRWDLFARVGWHCWRNSEHSFALYGELSHACFISNISKGSFNVLDPSINARYVWKPKKWWSYYCSIGMGLPKGMGDNYDRVKDAINLKSPDVRIQIGVNYRFNKKVHKQ